MQSRLLVFATHPTWYQVAFYRELARSLGENFLGSFVHGGHADGVVDPNWGGAIKNNTGLLDGYNNRVFYRRPGISQQDAANLDAPEVTGLVDSFQPAAILVNDSGRSLPYRRVIRHARRKGIRLLLRSTPYDLKRRTAAEEMARILYLRQQYRKFDAFCALGTLPRLHFERYSGRPGDVYDSPYCTDEFFLEPLAKKKSKKALRDAFRARHGIGVDERVFLVISRLVPKKRVDWTLAAISETTPKRAVRLAVVGDGPEAGRLKGLASGNVVWLGAQNRRGTAEAIAGADALLLASDEEPWGVVVNEAMFFGRPVVASNRVASAFDLIYEGETGFKFRWDEMGDYCRAIYALHDLLDRGLHPAFFLHVCHKFSARAAAEGILCAANL